MPRAGTTEETSLKVFISYSRKDEVFAQDLLAGLEVGDVEPYLDRHDVAAGEAWEARLARLIESADAVVFVISPESITSPRCAWEIERAHELKKRLLPIVWRAVDDALVPARLKQLNYIFFDRPHSFGSALKGLVEALRTDIDWIREHTRIGEVARRWDGRARADALLLRGEELVAASAWRKAQPEYAPEPTLLMLDLIQASEDAEATRSNAEQQRLDRLSAAIVRERAAQEEREKALAREREALRAAQRALAGAAGLFACIVVGAVGWFNQSYLIRQYTWYAVMHPSVLSAKQEKQKSAKPGSSFAECANACPVMIVVPTGKFMMGTIGENSGDEGPQHEVTIAKPFAVSRSEITFAEWDACVAALVCPRLSDNTWGRDNRPAILMSWEEAKQYVTWLSKLTGGEYRLLSEAEWEYAARAGNPGKWSFGDTDAEIGDYAWQISNSENKTHPVGEKKPNAFGLYDMHGNVREWVEDCWHDNYAGKPDDLKQSGGAWTGGDCGGRVVRGGSWNNGSNGLRSALRNRPAMGYRGSILGFRIARTLAP